MEENKINEKMSLGKEEGKKTKIIVSKPIHNDGDDDPEIESKNFPLLSSPLSKNHGDASSVKSLSQLLPPPKNISSVPKPKAIGSNQLCAPSSLSSGPRPISSTDGSTRNSSVTTMRPSSLKLPMPMSSPSVQATRTLPTASSKADREDIRTLDKELVEEDELNLSLFSFDAAVEQVKADHSSTISSSLPVNTCVPSNEPYALFERDDSLHDSSAPSSSLLPLPLSRPSKSNKRDHLECALSGAYSILDVYQENQIAVSESQLAIRALELESTSESSMSMGPAPSKKQKTKNNIWALAYEARAKEKELQEYHAQARRVRQETRHKYGF